MNNSVTFYQYGVITGVVAADTTIMIFFAALGLLMIVSEFSFRLKAT